MRSKRLIRHEDIEVTTLEQVSVWDPTLGRNRVTTKPVTLLSFKGRYEPLLRAVPPVDDDRDTDRRGVVRGRVYAEYSTALIAVLEKEDARITLADGNVLTPILKPKPQGGAGGRVRIDCGDWL
jgi:hypothetical protein